MDDYQRYIAASRYARWLPEEGRRETWDETVTRYMNFWDAKDTLDLEEYAELHKAITNLEVMPSMRCLMTAGPALERDNVAGFNCSYLPVDHPRAFDELMYILLCGTGVGYSVENKYVKQLPEVPSAFFPTDTDIVVADSKVGWAKAFKQLVSLLYAGEVPGWDVSRVRPAGAPLVTFGGRASGPEPLVELFRFTIETFKGAAGRQLSDLECSDLCCKIAQVIVVGGVRRSALICLCDPESDRMRRAKTGNFGDEHPERYLANISAVYHKRPDFDFFYNEMGNLYESKSGERGIFSRKAAQMVASGNGRRDSEWEFGTNPCSEIILRPNQFCNLSEVVVRPEDTLDDLKGKVRKATILGTLQATLTDFRYLRKVWKTNTEEEALLGVSLTGIMDHPVLSGREGEVLEEWLTEMKETAIETNLIWAERLGINPSVAITCVKPSGTVSQLVDSASGIHPRFAPYYVRRVRGDAKDPLSQFLVSQGVPHEEAIGSNGSTLVFDFPKAAPEGAVCAKDMGAMEQLRLWLVYQEHWCEHKPSQTVYYTPDEFFDVSSWCWKNFDKLSGVSFLPLNDHVYAQAPYEEISGEQWGDMLVRFPDIDWQKAAAYEAGLDSTTGSQELACVGGACEL